MNFPYASFPELLPRTRFIKGRFGAKYLDFGCGDGTVLRQNLRIKPDLTAFGIDIFDFSRKMPPNIEFSVFDGLNIPFPQDSFDLITANHVLEHVSNPLSVLRELRRVAKPGGKLFIETPNERSLRPRKTKRFTGAISFFDDGSHIRPFSVAALIELASSSGFTVIKSGISRNLFHLMLSPFLYLAGVLKPDTCWYMYARNSLLGWSAYIVLEKPR